MGRARAAEARGRVEQRASAASNSKAEEAGDAKVADDGDVKERQQWSALKLCRRSGTRDWFACVTYEKATAPTPLVQDIISVDPGVRRGLVAYSAATGAITYMGETVTPQQPGGDPLALGASLARLRPIANGAQQQLSLSQGRDFIARRRLQRTHRQVRQAVDNFHWHAARDLSRAAVVLLPKFSASQMLRKARPQLWQLDPRRGARHGEQHANSRALPPAPAYSRSLFRNRIASPHRRRKVHVKVRACLLARPAGSVSPVLRP